MGEREFSVWCAYRKKYGPLNPVRKYDAGAALIAAQITSAHGGKAKPIDFMPCGKEEPEVVETEEDIIKALLAGGAKVGKRR